MGRLVAACLLAALAALLVTHQLHEPFAFEVAVSICLGIVIGALAARV